MATLFYEGETRRYANTLKEPDVLINPHWHQKYTTSHVSLVRVKNATLFATRRCIRVQDEQGTVVHELGLLGDQANPELLDATPIQQLDSPLIYFQHFSPQCFYHWLIDTEPAFGVLDLAGINPTDDYHFYLHALVGGLQQKTLREYGVDTARVISFFRDSMKNPSLSPVHVQAPEIIVPRFRLDEGMWPNQWSFEYLRSKYLDRRPTHEVWKGLAPGNRKAFLARGDTPTRKIGNEAVLQKELELLGFRPVLLQNYSLYDQALIMRDADYVLASHGSAITNVLFCPKGTRVFEFCGSYLSNHFRVLCDMLEQKHSVHAVGITEAGESMSVTNHGSERDSDYLVDLDLLLGLVKTDLGINDRVGTG